MNRRYKASHIAVAALGLLIAGDAGIADEECCECFHQLIPDWGKPITAMRMSRSYVKLDGTAKGGDLVLMEMVNPNPRYIKIDTHAGETAETVIARMAAAINEVSPFNPYRDRMRIPNEKGEMVSGDKVPIVHAEGNLLKTFGGFPGSYIFAGTETGLGIPPPPTSLTATYDPQSQKISLHWENPDEPYDAIGGSVGMQPGTITNFVQKHRAPEHRANLKEWEREIDRRDKGLRRFSVIGCRSGVLSNAAAITWDFDDDSQQELDIQPFTAGICPNWKGWSYGGEPGTLVLEQGTRGEWKQFDQRLKGIVLTPDDKRFFQLIKTRSPTVVGGVCRKFLGLQPGHTYRIWTRMNTLDMENVKDNWSFSFHAVPHGKAVTLSSQQMAGTAPLPAGSAGSAGSQAGQVASCGTGSTTKGKFVDCSTEKSGPNSQVLDITLPAGAEVITVWFRYSGPPCSGVGFDWIKLKDITTR